MNLRSIILYAALALFFSCRPANKTMQSPAIHVDSLLHGPSKTINSVDDTLKGISKNVKPVFGYRFVIIGDFNGDGRKEKLIEHFFSAIDGKETNKFWEGLSDYDQLIELTMKKKPVSFITSDNKEIDTLPISSDKQILGLAYLKNEGDLNGDGTDEVSYVVNWADRSNLNTWHVVTYHNKAWKELYSFPIWDWQLPDLPETFNHYGLFGLEQKIIDTQNNAINKQIEKNLLGFRGLVKKIKRNKIQIIFRNDEAVEDSMVVNLKRLK